MAGEGGREKVESSAGVSPGCSMKVQDPRASGEKKKTCWGEGDQKKIKGGK